MQKLTGSYIWHYVSNDDRIEGIKEGFEYLVCFEVEEEKGSVWKMKLAHWFEKEARIKVKESDGTPHDFVTDKDGFYILDDLGGSKGPRCFRLHNVRYWTAISEPKVNPEDILTIV